MRIGLQVNRFDWPGSPENIGDTFRRIAQRAEEMNFYSLWVMDHYYQITPMLGNADDPMLEAYTTLGYLAGVTEKIKLGTMVTGVIYRYPAHLVKSVTTLDVLSWGRAYFGVGAAWYEKEAEGLGFPFPPLSIRFQQLEETLQIAKKMWSGDRSAFNGKHFQMTEPINSPMPLTKPHPPILIGGGGERKTLRLVAQYGDACNLFARLGDKELSKKLDILKQHCDQVGRDFDEIELTTLYHVDLDDPENSPSKIIKRCEELAKLGFTHVIISLQNVDALTPLDIVGEKVIPQVRSF